MKGRSFHETESVIKILKTVEIDAFSFIRHQLLLFHHVERR